MRLSAGPLATVAMLVLGALLAACGPTPTPTPSPTPTATATPTPAPTPTPTPLPSIVVSEEIGAQEVFDQLPTEERACIRQELGGAALGQFLEGNIRKDISDREVEALLGCTSQNTVMRLVTGFLASEAGALSDPTLTCIRSALSNLDLRALLFDANLGERSAVISFLGMLLCLDDEEAARVDVSRFFREGDLEVSLAQLRCAVSRVDIGVTLDLLKRIEERTHPPQKVLDAFVACGVQLGEVAEAGGDEGAPTALEITPQQIECLLASLGLRVLTELRSGSRAPIVEDLEAIRACGVAVP